MDKDAMLGMISNLKAALPNLKHSLSNIRGDENVVKLTVQLSGINSGELDLRKMGMGVIPRSQKFIHLLNSYPGFRRVLVRSRYRSEASRPSFRADA